MRLPVVGSLVWSRVSDRQRRSGLRSAVAPEADVPEVFVEDLRATSHSEFVGSTRAIDRYLSQRPLAERLAALEVPVRVVFGREDQRVDPSSLSVYDAVPRAEIIRLEGIGHSPPWEAPEAVAAAI